MVEKYQLFRCGMTAVIVWVWPAASHDAAGSAGYAGRAAGLGS
jgi:hypothetical protein